MVTSRSVMAAAARAKRELEAHARPAGAFDASRYFRTTEALGFLNIRTSVVRDLGKSIAKEHRDLWNVKDAVRFADVLIRDRHLEVKGVGVEALACFRRQFSPGILPTVKGWLAKNHSANWATTDSICGSVISPLLLAHPALAKSRGFLDGTSQHVGAACGGGVAGAPGGSRARARSRVRCCRRAPLRS